MPHPRTALKSQSRKAGSISNRTFEPLLTADEAAEHLRIHVKTLQRLAREQRVPSVRMGKYWRFRLSPLDQWVTAQQNETSQPFRVN